MFDPKISENKLWTNELGKGETIIYNSIGPLVEAVSQYQPLGIECENPDDAKAIIAVPELLAVYKAAKALYDYIDYGYGLRAIDLKGFLELGEAIEKLEEKHCEY